MNNKMDKFETGTPMVHVPEKEGWQRIPTVQIDEVHVDEGHELTQTMLIQMNNSLTQNFNTLKEQNNSFAQELMLTKKKLTEATKILEDFNGREPKNWMLKIRKKESLKKCAKPCRKTFGFSRLAVFVENGTVEKPLVSRDSPCS